MATDSSSTQPLQEGRPRPPRRLWGRGSGEASWHRYDPARQTDPDSALIETAPMPLSTVDCRQAGAATCGTIHLQGDSAPDPTVPVAIDRVLAGRYCLERELGRGGFGVVMLAYDCQLQRQVAIKIARRTTDLSVDHLMEEGRKVAQLDHPNIVPVYDCGRIDEPTIFIVSKYVDGGSLASQLSLRRLALEETVAMACQVAEALAHAHEKGLIHRDLKPSNILLDLRNNAHVSDFGLALRTADRSDQHCVEGSVQYMSPEQVAGKSRLVDLRTDVFSFGVILYEMLTGRRPFPGRSAGEYREQVTHEEPVPPSRIVPGIPPCLEQLCLKAMAKDPTDRYASAWEIARELKQCLAAEPCRRRKARLAFCVALAAALVLVPLLIAALLLLGPRSRGGAGPEPAPPAPLASSALDRQATDWVLGRGGAVDFEDFPPRVRAPEQVPEHPGPLVTVDLKGIRPITSEEVALICSLPGLRHLHLAATGIGDADLETISRKTNLSMLWLCWNDLTDRGLSRLGRLQGLRHLDLERTGLTDAGLRGVAGARELVFLNLSMTHVTDRGLASLRPLPWLGELWLNETSVSDEAIDDLLALRSLTKLELKGTRVTPEGLERLRAGLPGCTIAH